MSLHKFGFTSKRLNDINQASPPPKKPKLDKKQRDKLYDVEKRTRGCVPSWKDEFLWVDYDSEKQLLTCLYCRDYPFLAGKNQFVKGSDSLHHNSLKSHNDTEAHKSCRRRYYADHDKQPPSTSDSSGTCIGKLDQAFKNIAESDRRMYSLFNIAYYLGKERKPLTDMKKQCMLAKKLGVDVGSNYHNDLSAKQFLNATYTNLIKDVQDTISGCNFISILSDGSTDISVVEQEVVYVRYIKSNGRADTVLVNIVAPEHGHGLGLFEAIKTALLSIGLDFENMRHDQPGPSLVCANFDGASVMQGRKSGVVGHILNEIPDIIPIHCIAHKLELAVLDSIKNIPFLKRYEDTMKGIFITYHASPKKLRGLNELAVALEVDILQFSDLKKTRWVSSKSRAVIALKNNLSVVAAHLESMAADNIPEAKAYHTTLVSVQFLKIMHLLLDFLPIITRVSKVFQYKDIMIYEVEEQLEGIMLDLLNMSQNPGTNMKEFLRLYKPADKKFADTVIKGPTPNIDWKDDNQLRLLVQDTIAYLDKRY